MFESLISDTALGTCRNAVIAGNTPGEINIQGLHIDARRLTGKRTFAAFGAGFGVHSNLKHRNP
jgi:hypothetical protein